MRKAGKWIISGVTLLVVGIVLFVVGMSLLKWDFLSLDTEKYEAKQFVLTEEQSAAVTKVELNVDSFPVAVTAGDALALDYFESDRRQISVAVQDGVLKITENRARWSWDRFSFGVARYKFALTVPNGLDLQIKGTNADVEMRGVTAGDMTVRGTNNDVKLSDCTLSTLGVHTTNSTTVLTDVSCGAVTIDVTNLDMTAKNCAWQALEVKSTNGDVEISDTTCQRVSLRSTNADYDLKRVTVDDLALHATNLDAEVLLIGVEYEYSVQSHGKNLPGDRTGSTAKKVTLSGTNNDVSLKWVQA